MVGGRHVLLLAHYLLDKGVALGRVVDGSASAFLSDPFGLLGISVGPWDVFLRSCLQVSVFEILGLSKRPLRLVGEVRGSTSV